MKLLDMEIYDQIYTDSFIVVRIFNALDFAIRMLPWDFLKPVFTVGFCNIMHISVRLFILNVFAVRQFNMHFLSQKIWQLVFLR